MGKRRVKAGLEITNTTLIQTTAAAACAHARVSVCVSFFALHKGGLALRIKANESRVYSSNDEYRDIDLTNTYGILLFMCKGRWGCVTFAQ